MEGSVWLLHLMPSNDVVLAAPEKEVNCCKKAYNWFCGLEQTGPKLSKEEEEALQHKLMDTTEEPFWRRVVNINAIILLTVAVFCHGFFA